MSRTLYQIIGVVQQVIKTFDKDESLVPWRHDFVTVATVDCRR